jgi:hypothetical protein
MAQFMAVSMHQPVDVNGNPCGNFLIQDGEDIVLRAAMDDEVVCAFNELGVNSCKGEPSHTELTQELDSGTVFRDLKAGVLKTAAHKRDCYKDSTLSRHLNEYCSALVAKFPGVKLSSKYI